MDMRIVYQEPGRPVVILAPGVCGLTLEQIGRKDVTRGVPFWIVGADSIPVDRELRDAWELDVSAMGNPSGFGGEE